MSGSSAILNFPNEYNISAGAGATSYSNVFEFEYLDLDSLLEVVIDHAKKKNRDPENPIYQLVINIIFNATYVTYYTN
ncbi:hypothetical protein MtrunA17_Chr1g0186691 [Medicago truncatula]|nr:hypothetical protein MtrunA17_Chr1g0186691 [Medicago truncatula]